jgi:hypothetical protein
MIPPEGVVSPAWKEKPARPGGPAGVRRAARLEAEPGDLPQQAEAPQGRLSVRLLEHEDLLV